MNVLTLGGWGMVGCLVLVLTGMVSDGRRRAARLARSCHELRGPLTAARLGLALGVGEAAGHGATPPGVIPARAIDAELRRAAWIVDELSGTPGATGGVRGYAPRPIDVAGLIADVAEARRPGAAAAGKRIETWLDPVAVIGEELPLAQAVGNLIDNAIAHGGDRILVEAGVRAGRVRIEIRDDGPGLAEPVEAIIRRARRARRARRTRRAGRGRGRHGHGLAVAAEVAAAYGGRLSTAPSSAGARLVLELPGAL